MGEDRRCPHCGTPGAISRGKARGLRRYRCKGCKKTFDAASGTALAGLHRKDKWLAFGPCLADGLTVRASAERCRFAVNIAFRWRHRFLAAETGEAHKLTGIVEADAPYVLESRKGERHLKRKARRRGGKAGKRGLSDEQGPVLLAADRSGMTVSAVLPAVNADTLRTVIEPVVDKHIVLVSDDHRAYPPCAATLDVCHEALDLSRGERVRDAFTYSDGEQPTQPFEGLPATLSGDRNTISRQRSAMVSTQLSRKRIPAHMPRRCHRQVIHTICKLSLCEALYGAVESDVLATVRPQQAVQAPIQVTGCTSK